MTQTAMSIFILPSEPLTPPQALLNKVEVSDDFDEPESEIEMTRCPNCGEFHAEGILVRWSADIGTWINPADGMPLPTQLSERLTERAKELGVEW